MSLPEPPDAVHKTILVRCPIEVAFRTWTEKIDRWWPKGHSRSGDPGAMIFLEPRLGGRLYERTPDGAEFVWGRVLVWEPTRRLAYHWYPGSGEERPSRVDVQFSVGPNGHTQVDITHRGPELIGDLWGRAQHRFTAAWEHVLDAYRTACNALEQEGRG